MSVLQLLRVNTKLEETSIFVDITILIVRLGVQLYNIMRFSFKRYLRDSAAVEHSLS